MKIGVLGCTDSMYHDGPRIAQAFCRKGHIVGLANLATESQKTVAKMREFVPDFCFVTIGRGYDVEALKEMGSFTSLVHWAYDEYTPKEDSLYNDVKGIYDLTFVKTKGLLPLLADYCKKAVWTPMYYDQYCDGIRLTPTPKTMDLLFVGEPHPVQSTLRQKYLKQLSDLPGVNVVGYYWDKFKSDLPQVNFLGGVIGPQLTNLITQAKINLNFDNDLLPKLELGFSDRVLKVLGAGGFLLTHEIPGIEQLFIPDTHLVTYKNYTDLCEKIDYYLYHPKEREKIASAGQQLVLEKYNIDRVTDLYIEEMQKLV